MSEIAYLSFSASILKLDSMFCEAVEDEMMGIHKMPFDEGGKIKSKARKIGLENS